MWVIVLVVSERCTLNSDSLHPPSRPRVHPLFPVSPPAQTFTRQLQLVGQVCNRFVTCPLLPVAELAVRGSLTPHYSRPADLSESDSPLRGLCPSVSLCFKNEPVCRGERSSRRQNTPEWRTLALWIDMVLQEGASGVSFSLLKHRGAENHRAAVGRNQRRGRQQISTTKARRTRRGGSSDLRAFVVNNLLKKQESTSL